MGNLRLIRYSVIDVTTLRFVFSDKLDSTISTANVEITSNTLNVPDATVMSVAIEDEELTVTTLPLTPFGVYRVKLFSTATSIFRSINGNVLLEDGNTNEPLITAPINPENDILNTMLRNMKNEPYDIDGNTIVRSILEANANQLYKARNTIGQLKTDNYVSISVEDEFHTRGDGPYDRIDNEGVYEIIRMSPYPSEFEGVRTVNISEFPREPITLQATTVQNENLVGGNSDDKGTFNGMILNLQHNNVSKVTSILIIYSGGSTFSYNLANLGFQLKDSKYDANASTYVQLNSNQVKFSERALDNGLIPPVIGDRIIISYEYKNIGVDADEDTISISEIKLSSREVCPPIATVFSLQYSNIVKSTGNAGGIGDVTFYDPKATPPFSETHAAFKNEIKFSAERMPSSPGSYSIDYVNGKVYVFGSDSTQDNVGSGPFPPVCTYYYKQSFTKDLDYTYEPELREIAANPTRDLIGSPVVLEFNYLEHYVEGVDYVAQIHKEELSERIQNRLYSNNIIKPLYSPITNVFRIFNETTGEIYRINRFDDSKIYFNFNTAPNVLDVKDERATFESVYDEVLIYSEQLTNASGATIWKIYLNNNNIINNSEDSIAANINTSLVFSDTETFVQETYYDREQTVPINLNKLTSIGDYVVDYSNGIIYVSVTPTAEPDIGSATYRSKYIVTSQPHILTVNLVYSAIDGVADRETTVSYEYNTFSDTKVDLKTYPVSDRRYESTDPDIPMLVQSNTVILPVEAKQLRGLYESTNLNSSFAPINFAIGSSVNRSTATIVPVEVINNSVVSGALTVVVPDVAVNSNFVINSVVYVKRISDGYELYNTPLGNGSFAGSVITLPTDTVGVPANAVTVSVMLTLADSSAVIADIDYGGLYIDYNALLDEIIISYEHGDNVLDFRESETILDGSEYYVSYKYGALRDSLLANFGSMIEIDELRNFDVDLNRERYRDALSACLQTFPKGPTIGAIKEIARKISHITPEIVESLFLEWVLGSSHLYDNDLLITGGQLLSAIWDYGIYFVNDGDTLPVPISSHVKFDGGTIEFWTIPNWDGIDNDATLSFQLFKDGYLLGNEHIWIGASGYHPAFESDNTFDVSRFDVPSVIGQPHNIKTDGYGAFIYYDTSDKFWNIIVKDQSRSSVYTGTVQTSGEFYNVRNILLEQTDIKTTKNTDISFIFKLDGYDGYRDGYDGYVDGMQWKSDELHYLLDYAENDIENRISVFKDGKGYLNLKVYSNKDRFDRAHAYQISHDISDWASGDRHHIAISNKINSRNHRDELHFFVDGFEVPNSLKYGGRPLASSTDRFRTVVPELVVGVVPKNTLAANDMITTVGSAIVTSASVDFGLAGIIAGDTLYIEEQGFAASYTIASIVDFHTLQLTSSMPITLTNVIYSINKWTAPVSTELMYESNLLVSKYDGITETELPGLRATVPAYAVSVDSYGQASIVIRSDVQAGDNIFIRTLGMNHRRVRQRMYMWSDGYENMIRTNLPPPINLDYTNIYPVTKVRYLINSSRPSYGATGGVTTVVGNNVSVIGINVDTQPSNEIGGRTLAVNLSGTNVDFTTPVRIRINGTTWSGALFEDVLFSNVDTQNTTEQFKTVTSFDGYVAVINPILPTVSFEIREANQITFLENDGYVPILRYSYEQAGSFSFNGSGNTVTNSALTFYHSQIGKSLVMSSPTSAVGTYIISSIVNAHTLTVTPAFSSPFINGSGKIYDISIARSGFQNGLFYFEIAGSTPLPYMLNQGYYDFDYATYLELQFELRSEFMHIGSDYEGNHQAKALIDEFRCLASSSTDTRIGEALPSSGRSITTDYLRNKVFEPDSDTILLLHMDELPPIDSSVPYTRYSSQYFQASNSVNSNFGQSLYIDENPLVIPNKGILSNTAGTIEFWFSPDFDSRNDSLNRYLFDANSALIEETTSLTKTTVTITNRALQVYSIQLQNDDTTTGVNYALGGTLSADGKSYRLGRALPYQQTPVKITYTPAGLSGNRISIYKDTTSMCRFEIFANNTTYELSTPVFWSRDTWHRIMATWDFSKSRLGEMHLFIDGEEKIVITAGSFIAGTGFVAGNVGPNTNTSLDIKLNDQFQEIYIGSNFLGGEVMSSKIDNLKISRIKKTPIYVSGQPFDNDYSANTSTALPVVEDLYTTYLLDATQLVNKIDDFTILKNEITGIYDFALKVFDSFDIINNNTRIEEILETLVNTLKPAQSRAFISYY